MEVRAENTDAFDREVFDLRCKIQYLIIVLMLKTGVIKHEIEYENFAPVFDMMTKGELFVPRQVDYNAMRQEFRVMVGEVVKKG